MPLHIVPAIESSAEFLRGSVNEFYPQMLGYSFLILSLAGLSPLSSRSKEGAEQAGAVKLRQLAIGALVLSPALPILVAVMEEFVNNEQIPWSKILISWFVEFVKENGLLLLLITTCGISLNYLYKRHLVTKISEFSKKRRNTLESVEALSDIRKLKFTPKNFNPRDYYPEKGGRPDGFFVGIDDDKEPQIIPYSTWYETNMQVVGPTRWGKGILLGNLMDQAIRRGDTVFYIDPKGDKFAPHIMYQACLDTGRPFIYLTLHDKVKFCKWAPFAGGEVRDGLARLELAFALAYTGTNADYYKAVEKSDIVKAFHKNRDLDSLFTLAISELQAKNDKKATETRVIAELKQWREIESLRPDEGKGFSIEKALLENAVVYVQGALRDDVVTKATTVFIVECIQEASRLFDPDFEMGAENEDKPGVRKAHFSMFVDEVSFLVSEPLAGALATAIGFNINFVLSYQSQSDLLRIKDRNVNAEYVSESINQNSQVKAIYGGKNPINAEWASELCGTIEIKTEKSERTDVNSLGAETWNGGRIIGSQEVPLIHPNIMKKLPKRICLLVQPDFDPKIVYTAPVPVNSFDPLRDLVKDKELKHIARKKMAAEAEQARLEKNKMKAKEPKKLGQHKNQQLQKPRSKSDLPESPPISTNEQAPSSPSPPTESDSTLIMLGLRGQVTESFSTGEAHGKRGRGGRTQDIDEDEEWL